MDLQTLSAVSRSQGNNAALKRGDISVPGLSLAWTEVDPLVAAFRRMVRTTEFDVCEMAITTYLCAKEHGKPFTALPVFLVRDFHHGAISVLADGPVTSPKDLEGRRVGVNRGYTVTTGVWARGILGDQYGVDLDSITWVLSGDEHVAEYQAPDNVVSAGDGGTLLELLRGGELAAVIGVSSDDADIVPLIAEPDEAAFEALERDGLYPINHLVVVRDELLAAHPGLAPALFEAFRASKQHYVDALRAGEVDPLTRADRTLQRVMATLGTDDPLPYGIAPNLAVLERLIGYATDQRILTTTPALEDIFAPGTLDLVG
jgi:4,5-dihydroxyphthalate decarboxylase